MVNLHSSSMGNLFNQNYQWIVIDEFPNLMLYLKKSWKQ